MFFEGDPVVQAGSIVHSCTVHAQFMQALPSYWVRPSQPCWVREDGVDPRGAVGRRLTFVIFG